MLDFSFPPTSSWKNACHSIPSAAARRSPSTETLHDLSPRAPRTRSSGARAAKLPFRLKILLENLLRNEDDAFVKRADIEAMAKWDVKGKRRARDRVPHEPRAAPGLHRRSRGRRPRRHARRDRVTRRRSARSTRCSRSISSSTTRCRSTNTERKPRSSINTELEFERNKERYVFLRWGQTAFRELPRRAAGHRHRAPGQSRVSRPGRSSYRQEGGETRRVSRLARRHRLAHDDDQRPRRARLGRRRYRGRGGDARPAGVDADPGGRRLQAARQASRRARRRPTSCSP